MFDLNDVEPINSGELLPDGSFVKVTMAIRPGGVDGYTEIDRGLLKASNAPGSDVLSLDCEFTVVEGPYAKRKFWQLFTVAGGKVDDKGASIGWNISKRIFRAMIDSALGLDPEDMSEAAKAKRQLRGLADLNGISFVAKIAVEPNNDPRYPDHNRLDHPVLPTEKEWRAVMNGEAVTPRPSKARSAGSGRGAAAAQAPAWGSAQPKPAAAPQTTGAPLWQRPAEPSAPAPQPMASPAAQPVKPAGPAWLNG
ncbi:MAG: hypothetical protein KF815_03595 [Rhodospirillales bacterium]|nr:hypothetical protein [Rhodospirillales bacterium]